MSKTTLSPHQVQHIAVLANIPVSDHEAEKLAHEFDETLVVVDQLKSVNVKQVNQTHQVTGFSNVWRADEVNNANSFTQAQALANASASHEGYFLVPGVLTAKDT
jgi:aspartyl/glutamyl-tRNA(Asn/Gln) amidotransferase C subunit